MILRIYQRLKTVIFAILPRFILRPLLLFIHRKIFPVFSSQDNEEYLLEKLIKQSNRENKAIFFYEFGFGPTEFNCIKLSLSGEFGEITDLSTRNVSIARKIHHKNTRIIEKVLKPQDIQGVSKNDFFNILSIDVDGIDYEFAKEAFKSKPDILIVEYNSAFGNLRIKIKEIPNFSREDYHGNFHGASLLAFCDLAHSNGYCLSAVSKSAVNAFFVPTRLSAGCRTIVNEALAINSSGIKSQVAKKTWQELFEEVQNFPFEHLDNNATECPKNTGNHSNFD